jgi:negative regulator of sigma E activity
MPRLLPRPALHRIWLVVVAVLWAVVAAAAELPPNAVLPPVNDIVANLTTRNAQRAARLRGFRSTRVYTVDYNGFPSSKHASMTVEATYEAPQKKLVIVSQEGSKLLLNRVLRKLVQSEQEADSQKNRSETALNEENYDFTLLGTEAVGERNCYLLRVKPKRKNKYLYDGKIWVDAGEFAVVRIEASPAKNPSFWITGTSIEHQYAKTGDFWLPVLNRSTTKVRFGGRAVLAIDYGQYQLIGSK